MGVRVEIHPQVPATVWDEAVRASDDAWLFHLHRWIEFTATVWPLENYYFIARLGDRIAGGLPVQLAPGGRRPWVRPQAYSIWMGTGGPFVVRHTGPKARRRILAALTGAVRRWAEEVGASAVHCVLPPLAPSNLNSHHGVNPLVPFGWQDVSTHTWIRHLADYDDPLEALATNARRLCRRALQAGYQVERVDWLEALDRYYQLHVETYGRTGARPHPREYFEGIARHMAPEGYAVLWGCRNAAGELVAFHNCGRYGQGAFYWSGCSRQPDAKSGVNYLLFVHSMQAARQDGFLYYDIGEAFPGTADAKLKGLHQFKGKFGGQMYRFFRGRIDCCQRWQWKNALRLLCGKGR